MALRLLRSSAAATALVLQPPWGAVRAIRDSVDLGQEDLLAVDQEVARTRSGPSRKGLVVHAASFNSGNQHYKPDDHERAPKYEALLSDMSKDHDGADVVLFGLQEFGDIKISSLGFGKMAKDSLFKNGDSVGGDVAMHVATWFACQSDNCAKENHPDGRGDTNLYVYVNPYSSWEIKAVDYQSGKCIHQHHDAAGVGCTINNNQVVTKPVDKNDPTKGTKKEPECGKVVNLVVLDAARKGGAERLRLCAMNTHMSFAGSSAVRMKFMKEAMDEASAARCGSVVFLGDFNGRSHCLDMSVDRAAQPKAAWDTPGNFADSLENVLQTFHSGAQVPTLTGEHSDIDETTHLLQRDEVVCWEKKQWATSPNELRAQYKLVEGPVTFGPTYKVCPLAKVEEEVSDPKIAEKFKFTGKGYSKCYPGKKNCYVNPDRVDKHNPAWADRVLAWSGTDGQAPQFEEYYSVDMETDMGSDHLPVVARVLFPTEQRR